MLLGEKGSDGVKLLTRVKGEGGVVLLPVYKHLFT